ncbi:MAG TPA: Holliday junction branch migration protein RuvA [Verrucomicrobiales bacterium]|jgi:Holliday junction DNA helicase RuvA|nr:Holliday junction branch migration protein RuvA [Verrucomicrobiales bacterium]
MITFLRGRLASSLPDRACIDVGGVGYEVYVPVSTYDRLGETGREVTLLTHFHVREQEQTLFGFATDDERDLFRLLINRVTGVGPKMGLAILSGMSVKDFKRHVVHGDIASLSKISGVGKKTAERIIFELKDKVGVSEAWKDTAPGAPVTTPQQAVANDVILALINLGYKQVEAQKAVKKALDDGVPADQGSVLRSALRQLSQS